MSWKKIFSGLNFIAQCKRYNLPLWQCPHFLFLIIGLVDIFLIFTSYALATRYIEDPATAALIVLIVAAILFILDFIIEKSVENLAEANLMKSEFISITSHQLRAPLSSAKWALELLLSGRLGKIEERQRDYFKILKDNLDEMLNLLSDLLIVSKIETGRLPCEKKEFSLAKLTQNLIKEYQPLAESLKVKVFLESENNFNVFADPSQIKIAIENLLDNAIRYTKEGGEVKIRIFKKINQIYFEIKDTGVGIPKEEQKYIFQKFFRSPNVLQLQPKGTGLGLYITKALIERSGGKIGFFSQEGKGSTFWFTLPTKK